MQHSDYHPTALVETQEIGEGTRVWAYAHILAGARIGRDCNIGDHVFIEGGAIVGNRVTIKNHVCLWEGVTVEDDVFIGPHVAFTNDRHPRSPRMAVVARRYADKRHWLTPTCVQHGCSVGAQATILPGVKLGEFCLIAAGAVVTGDVEPFALMMGVPARRVGAVCRCGIPVAAGTDPPVCPDCAPTTNLPS